MKPSTDIYLNKVFHLPKCWGVTHRVSEAIHEKHLLKMIQKNSFLT